ASLWASQREEPVAGARGIGDQGGGVGNLGRVAGLRPEADDEVSSAGPGRQPDRQRRDIRIVLEVRGGAHAAEIVVAAGCRFGRWGEDAMPAEGAPTALHADDQGAVVDTGGIAAGVHAQ